MTEACDLSATEARRLIGEKRLSPVELLDSCIARIEAVNGAVNAIVATCHDRAKVEAQAAEDAVMRGKALPLLHGLPIGIKDLNLTAGLRTTYGSPIYENYVPEEDDLTAANARRAGAIVVGKTNTTEFGAGSNTTNSVFGPTRNPFDLARTCGGSSGGSAVALACNMMPLCTGTDTGGSLRLPATYSGVVSLRPTPGLVPFDRRTVAMTPFQVQGPMARTVADMAMLLEAMAVDDPIDPLAYPRDAAHLAAPEALDLSRLRVAVLEDLGFAPTSQAIRGVFRERVAAFRDAFGRCEERHPDMATAPEVNWILRGIQFLAAHKERYESHRDKLGPNVVSNYESALKMTVEQVAWANREQMRLHRAMQHFFQDFDLLICPGATVPPFPVQDLFVGEIDGKKLDTYVQWAGLTNALSVAGTPVVALPCGLDPTGTPFGFQLVGPRRSDGFLLGAAQALERLFAVDPKLARPVPDLRTLTG